MTTIHKNEDEAYLEKLGYKQSLHRGIGKFGSFAAGVSFISILTGTFQLFYLGYASAGPAYLWSWPIVFIGQGVVALCFMELASYYPVAGSVYNWTKMLGKKTLGWCGGWLMLTAAISSMASVTLGFEGNLPFLWKGFQFIGDPKNPTPTDLATNALILGTIAITLTTIINCGSVKVMNFITSAGVLIELLAALAIAILLLFHPHNKLNVFMHPNGFTEYGKFIPAFLMGSIASGYVMYGFDTASSLSEETHNPRKTAPWAIAQAVVASFILGGAILFFAIIAAPNIHDPRLKANDGLQYLIQSVLGTTLSYPIFICTTVAVFVCALTVHTASIRLIFAMSRDNNLPASQFLSKSIKRYGTPAAATVTVGILGIAILLINLGQPQIFSTLSSIAVIMIYLAYLAVTGAMLFQRCRGKWPVNSPDYIAHKQEYFSMGKFGFITNVLAVLWGVCMTINIGWPRTQIYGKGWFNTYAGILYPVVIIGVGLLWYLLRGRKSSHPIQNLSIQSS